VKKQHLDGARAGRHSYLPGLPAWIPTLFTIPENSNKNITLQDKIKKHAPLIVIIECETVMITSLVQICATHHVFFYPVAFLQVTTFSSNLAVS
jgi:hypothetical protein